MAYIKFSKTKKGVLVARIQISGKDPQTGEHKIYPKNIQNEDGLSEAKFKKKINLLAAELEQQIADDYKNKTNHIHTGILTFSQLAKQWISGIIAHQSHNYYLRASNVCKTFNEYLKSIGLDRKPISEIKVRDVQLFINTFNKGYVKGKPTAKLRKALPDYVSFRELAREKILSRCSSYRMNHDDCCILLSSAQELCEYIHRVIPIKIMLLCGLRNGEVHGLRWTDIDLDNGILYVNRSRLTSPERGVYEKGPKSKTSKRSVPIPAPLVEDLRKYYNWFEIADQSFDTKLDQYYIASTIYRTPSNPTSLRSWLTNFEKKHGFKHISCHGLRHTYCSLLLSQNVPIQTVSRYLGHSDSTVTLQVYSHFIPDTQEKVINALNKLF